MRLNVKGQMFKFDFEQMQQKNLNTLEVAEMRAPHDALRPARKRLFDTENIRHPRSKGFKVLKEKMHRQRPVFVVRAPEGSAGTTIRVPHPKKLGKAIAVAVPTDAKAGQPLFISMPRTEMNAKIKYGAGGAAAGTTGAAMAVAITNVTSGAAAGAAGGALATAATVAAAAAGGLAVVGCVAAAGVGVHYARRNPGKAVAIGALTIGGIAFASHAAEVGVVEAVDDVSEVCGDFVEGCIDTAEGIADAAEDFDDAFMDAGEWLGDSAEHGVDIILDLF
jgi:hypothetical protein